jgi:hypothetical protein
MILLFTGLNGSFISWSSLESGDCKWKNLEALLESMDSSAGSLRTLCVFLHLHSWVLTRQVSYILLIKTNHSACPNPTREGNTQCGEGLVHLGKPFCMLATDFSVSPHSAGITSVLFIVLFLCWCECLLGTIFWAPPFSQGLEGTLDKAPVEG